MSGANPTPAPVPGPTNPTPAPAPAAATTTPTVFNQPPNPIMGIYLESYPRAGDWYAISGGKPLPDWSGLDPSATKTNPNPRQQRSINAASKRKSYKYLTEGIENKFKQGMNITDFRDDIYKHLIKHGLDTISYLPDIADNSKVSNIVKEYPRFVGSLSESLKIAKSTQANYDEFDNENSEAGIEFLLASLDDSLKRRLNLHEEIDDTFATKWLRLMQILTSISSKHYDDVRQKIRQCSPIQYAQENIVTMVEAILIDISELECANQYEPSLTLTMLKNIINTCTQKGLFQHEVMTKIQEVNKEVTICNFMPRNDANDHMIRMNLDPKSVLSLIQELYETLLKDAEWTPAKRPIDRARPSINTINANPNSNQELITQLVALLQSSPSTDPK